MRVGRSKGALGMAIGAIQPIARGWLDDWLAEIWAKPLTHLCWALNKFVSGRLSPPMCSGAQNWGILGVFWPRVGRVLPYGQVFRVDKSGPFPALSLVFNIP